MQVLEVVRQPGHDMEKSDFGRRLRELRRAAGLSQKELAGKLGVPQSAVSQWESGIHTPAVTDIPDMAAALGADPGDLFKPASADVTPRTRGRPPKAEEPAPKPRRRGKGK
jgi:transcriptional regulator with XRE-family HTH domain